MNDLDCFKAAYRLRDEDVLLFPFGSRVYGTHEEDSDYDYLAALPESLWPGPTMEYRRNNLNIHVYGRPDFQRQLDEHQVHALEAYFLPGGVCVVIGIEKENVIGARRETPAG